MGGCNACLVFLVDGELFSAEPNRRRHASLEYFVHGLTLLMGKWNRVAPNLPQSSNLNLLVDTEYGFLED